jgi:hypothetical protein
MFFVGRGGERVKKGEVGPAVAFSEEELAPKWGEAVYGEGRLGGPWRRRASLFSRNRRTSP